MDHAYRSPWRLIVVILFGLLTLSGCTKTTGGVTASSATATDSSGAVLTKADQQISQQKISAARKTLNQVSNPNKSVKNLATGLRYYQKAADALNDNQLSSAKTYFQTLSDYQGTTDATFIAARRKLERQYQAVKLANGYYNAARDQLSMHDLTGAKTNIDKLDSLSASHPVIKKLQQKALDMKQAIMNYEASQSTSSGSASSTVTSSSSSSSATSSDSQTSATASDNGSHSTSGSSTATSSASSSTSSSSSSHEPTTADIIKQFQDAAGGTFANDTEFDITKKTSEYYQIAVIPADSSQGSSSENYRYYPDSGKVTKEDSSTGEFD
ncbi:hypothetical protein D1831_07910 [Lactiplantibacillus garii]|uniref:Lipoprotein n=1 Tax=Lactiplantibacillus garii TaxID=2306423 RepID=A0A3R8L0X1_9LACO|nr:hypothetical protein [Lactiplantibacillus garii]RRK10377.1 hypothetical protein D1831_07910 [Lactiplantibacillus garii]